MKFEDIKKVHYERVNLAYQIQPGQPADKDTGWKCLDNARSRMEMNLQMNLVEKSFEQALDSAEGNEIFTVFENGDKDEYKAIVRNLKDSWQSDSKFINAPEGVGFEVGNTITWVKWKMKWLIVWRDYNYSEFFRGEMQRASHLLRWKNKNGIIKEQWAVVLGPVETKAKYEQTRGNVIAGRQNDTVEIWIGANGDKDVSDLSRFSKIKISGRTWRIHVVDDISSEGIIRINCIEDFNNEVADDDIWLIPNGQIDFAENDNLTSEVRIVGDYSIPEKILSSFYAIGSKEERLTGDWTVESKGGFEVKTEVEEDGTLNVIGATMKDVLTITFTSPIGTNSIEVKVVSMFSQRKRSDLNGFI